MRTHDTPSAADGGKGNPFKGNELFYFRLVSIQTIVVVEVSAWDAAVL